MEIIIELTQGSLHMTITYDHESIDYILNLFFCPKFHEIGLNTMTLSITSLPMWEGEQSNPSAGIYRPQAQTSSMCFNSWTYRFQSTPGCCLS